MPVYPFYCEKCGEEKEVYSLSFALLKIPKCETCFNKMSQDMSKKNVGTVYNGLGWARDGYSKDIDDAEERWKKDGKPTGYWTGSWCSTDPNTGKADIKMRKVPKKKTEKIFVSQAI